MTLHSKIVFTLAALSMLWMLSPPDANAQENMKCPETAEQALFNMKLRVRAGQVSDGMEVFNLANTALVRCRERDEVQGLAAELFAMIASSVEKPEEKFLVWSKAYEAAVNNHNAFDHGTSPVVKLPDGSDRTLYPYATVSEIMKDHITKNLFELWLLDHVHPILEDNQLAQCPYNAKQGRVRDEVEGLRNTGARLRPNGGGTVALRRIYHLRSVCTEQTSFINLMLAELHAEVANFAIIRKRRDVAVDHAEASLALYQKIKYMDPTDSQDAWAKDAMTPRINKANELLAKAQAAKQTDPIKR